jgi:hypothetical protein
MLPTIVGCVDDSEDDGASMNDAHTFSYAYNTSEQLVLVRDEDDVITVDGVHGAPTFTEDGRFLFARQLGSIVVVDVIDSGIRTIECDCLAAVPAGGSAIAWLDGGDRLTTVDSAVRSAAPDELRVPVPKADPGFDFGNELLAVAGGRALIQCR